MPAISRPPPHPTPPPLHLTVYVLERVKAPTGAYLLYSEVTVTGANTDGSAANATAAGAANASLPEWLGCITAEVPAIAAGELVATLENIGSPEACCRACRNSSGCNTWTLCTAAGGCRWAGQATGGLQ